MLSNISFSLIPVLTITFFDLTFAGVSHPHPGSWNSLARRADGDETDHSDIKKWAALGDSFAAGIGAGTRLSGWGDWYCSRYDDSYPSLINRSPSLGDSNGRDFKYYACSGAVTTDVKNKQIPGLSGLQMATLSIGGNDANLKDILHACIYQWNKDPQLDCDKTLADSQNTINDPKFSQNLDDVLNALRGAMADSNAKIYWTGYSHFWDTSTDECDKVTWAFKYNIGNRQYLTKDRRITMNKLVDAVNQKIQDAIGRFGDQGVFVPWGPDVDYIVGHYCEPGVDESNAIDREQTAFYEWGTTKDDEGGSEHDELRKRQAPGILQDGQDLKDTWEGAIASWVTDAIKDGAKPEDFDLTQDDVVDAQSGILLPDKYGRIFHPTRFAHMMIAENVLRTMDLIKAKSIGKKAATTTLIGCPIPTGPASHPGEHNSCFVDHPSDEVKFKVDDANKVIKDYCLKHQGNTVMSGPDGILERFQNGDDTGSSLILMASLNTEPPCQNYPNKGKLNFFECSDNFGSAMNDCDTTTVDQKLGGGKTVDCIFYSIRAIQGGVTPSSDPVPAPDPQRTCSLHLIQKGSYSAGGDPLFNPDAPLDYTVATTIYDGTDNDKQVIGQNDDADAGDKNPLHVTIDGVKDELIITPETTNDYIQFTLGKQSWKSSDDGSCSVGGWDPREMYPATRQMDCSFQC